VVSGQRKGAVAIAWSPYNQPGFWLLRVAPGQNSRFAAFGPGGRAGAAPATLPSPPNSAGLRWSTWRRFDPSSSPSATRPSVQASASTNRPKNREQKWDFRGSWLYRRLAIFGTIGLEKAFFSKASYYVGLVRFRKVKRQRHNLK